jgi:hypothetical protein
MDLFEELRRVASSLDAGGIPYALCGGLAVAAHGHVRATKDIDLLILPDDLHRATECLGHAGFIHPGGELPLPGPGRSVRRVHRLTRVVEPDHVTVDLLLVTDGELQIAWNSRSTVELGDFPLTIVSKDGLIAMKRGSNRPIDQDDIARLGRG